VQGSVTTASDSGTTGPSGPTSIGSTGPTPVGPAAITFTTNSITLEPSQITGTVAAIDTGSLSFSLATRPASFVAPARTPGGPPTLEPVVITVQTTSATTFKNFTPNDISGLAVNGVVSVHGWLFSTPSGGTATTVAADGVLLRPRTTASF
jgi:hypothetical protein